MIRFADDTAVLAKSREELLEVVENTLRITHNMSINKSKTKILAMSKQDTRADMRLGRKRLDNVNELCAWVVG